LVPLTTDAQPLQSTTQANAATMDARTMAPSRIAGCSDVRLPTDCRRSLIEQTSPTRPSVGFAFREDAESDRSAFCYAQ